MQIIRDMLNHGAVVESSNNIFRTPYDTAGLESHVDVVRELLNHIANVHSVRSVTDLSIKQLKMSMYVVQEVPHVSPQQL